MHRIKTIQSPEAVNLICEKLLQKPNQLILLGVSSPHQAIIARKEILNQLQDQELYVNRGDRIVAKNDSCVVIRIANAVFGRGYSLDMLIIDKNIPELESCLYAHIPSLRNVDNLYLLED